MEEERLWDFFIDICIGFWEGFLSDEIDWPPSDEVEECFELHLMLISEFIELYELVDCTESRVLSCLLLSSDCRRSSLVAATAGRGSECREFQDRDGRVKELGSLGDTMERVDGCTVDEFIL